MNWLLLLAQEQPLPEAPSPWLQVLPWVAIFVLFYFLLIAPMRRQKREQQMMLASLRKNDKVVTQGGILGMVVSIKEEENGQPAEVTLKVDDASNSRIRVLKSSIASILSRSEAEKQQ